MSDHDQQSLKKICPECGREFDPGSEYCDEDGTELFEYVPSPETEVDPLIGTELDDRFQILESLSSGAMGKVYRAQQTSVERDVAIKILHSEYLADDTAVKRFLREARSIAKLSHPNIVNLVDFGQDPSHDALYLAMELIEGRNVAEMLEEGRLRPNFAVEVAKQICGALSASHDQGLIHRDLKPANAMLLPLPEGRLQAKVVDFGIAHAVQSGTKLTKTGMVCGTPHYLAPEQATGDQVDGRADVYSLGILLYEMITGEVPYDADQSLEIAFKHFNEETPLLSEHDGLETVHDRLVDLVERMMRKEAEARPADTLEVRKELQTIQHETDLEPVQIEPNSGGENLFGEYILPSKSDGAGNDEEASQAEVYGHASAAQLPANPEAAPESSPDTGHEPSVDVQAPEEGAGAIRGTGELPEGDYEGEPTQVTATLSEPQHDTDPTGLPDELAEGEYEAEPTHVTTDHAESEFEHGGEFEGEPTRVTGESEGEEYGGEPTHSTSVIPEADPPSESRPSTGDVSESEPEDESDHLTGEIPEPGQWDESEESTGDMPDTAEEEGEGEKRSTGKIPELDQEVLSNHPTGNASETTSDPTPPPTPGTSTSSEFEDESTQVMSHPEERGGSAGASGSRNRDTSEVETADDLSQIDRSLRSFLSQTHWLLWVFFVLFIVMLGLGAGFCVSKVVTALERNPSTREAPASGESTAPSTGASGASADDEADQSSRAKSSLPS